MAVRSGTGGVITGHNARLVLVEDKTIGTLKRGLANLMTIRASAAIRARERHFLSFRDQVMQYGEKGTASCAEMQLPMHNGLFSELLSHASVHHDRILPIYEQYRKVNFFKKHQLSCNRPQKGYRTFGSSFGPKLPTVIDHSCSDFGFECCVGRPIDDEIQLDDDISDSCVWSEACYHAFDQNPHYDCHGATLLPSQLALDANLCYSSITLTKFPDYNVSANQLNMLIRLAIVENEKAIDTRPEVLGFDEFDRTESKRIAQLPLTADQIHNLSDAFDSGLHRIQAPLAEPIVTTTEPATRHRTKAVSALSSTESPAKPTYSGYFTSLPSWSSMLTGITRMLMIMMLFGVCFSSASGHRMELRDNIVLTHHLDALVNAAEFKVSRKINLPFDHELAALDSIIADTKTVCESIKMSPSSFNSYRAYLIDHNQNISGAEALCLGGPTSMKKSLPLIQTEEDKELLMTLMVRNQLNRVWANVQWTRPTTAVTDEEYTANGSSLKYVVGPITRTEKKIKGISTVIESCNGDKLEYLEDMNVASPFPKAIYSYYKLISNVTSNRIVFCIDRQNDYDNNINSHSGGQLMWAVCEPVYVRAGLYHRYQTMYKTCIQKLKSFKQIKLQSKNLISTIRIFMGQNLEHKPVHEPVQEASDRAPANNTSTNATIPDAKPFLPYYDSLVDDDTESIKSPSTAPANAARPKIWRMDNSTAARYKERHMKQLDALRKQKVENYVTAQQFDADHPHLADRYKRYLTEEDIVPGGTTNFREAPLGFVGKFFNKLFGLALETPIYDFSTQIKENRIVINDLNFNQQKMHKELNSHTAAITSLIFAVKKVTEAQQSIEFLQTALDSLFYAEQTVLAINNNIFRIVQTTESIIMTAKQASTSTLSITANEIQKTKAKILQHYGKNVTFDFNTRSEVVVEGDELLIDFFPTLNNNYYNLYKINSIPAFAEGTLVGTDSMVRYEYDLSEKFAAVTEDKKSFYELTSEEWEICIRSRSCKASSPLKALSASVCGIGSLTKKQKCKQFPVYHDLTPEFLTIGNVTVYSAPQPIQLQSICIARFVEVGNIESIADLPKSGVFTLKEQCHGKILPYGYKINNQMIHRTNITFTSDLEDVTVQINGSVPDYEILYTADDIPYVNLTKLTSVDVLDPYDSPSQVMVILQWCREFFTWILGVGALSSLIGLFACGKTRSIMLGWFWKIWKQLWNSRKKPEESDLADNASVEDEPSRQKSSPEPKVEEKRASRVHDSPATHQLLYPQIGTPVFAYSRSKHGSNTPASASAPIATESDLLEMQYSQLLQRDQERVWQHKMTQQPHAKPPH